MLNAAGSMIEEGSLPLGSPLLGGLCVEQVQDLLPCHSRAKRHRIPCAR